MRQEGPKTRDETNGSRDGAAASEEWEGSQQHAHPGWIRSHSFLYCWSTNKRYGGGVWGGSKVRSWLRDRGGVDERMEWEWVLLTADTVVYS